MPHLRVLRVKRLRLRSCHGFVTQKSRFGSEFDFSYTDAPTIFHSPLRPRPLAPLFPLRTPAKRPTHIIRINPTHHHLPPHTPRIDTRQLAPRLHRPGRMPGLWQIGVVAQRRVATIQFCAGRLRRRHRCRRRRGRHRSGWRRIGRKALWRKQI